jgi:hypothetical protein
LLLASRNPSAHRSLIAFTAWSSSTHAAIMGVQAYLNFVPMYARYVCTLSNLVR